MRKKIMLGKAQDTQSHRQLDWCKGEPLRKSKGGKKIASLGVRGIRDYGYTQKAKITDKSSVWQKGVGVGTPRLT